MISKDFEEARRGILRRTKKLVVFVDGLGDTIVRDIVDICVVRELR